MGEIVADGDTPAGPGGHRDGVADDDHPRHTRSHRQAVAHHLHAVRTTRDD